METKEDATVYAKSLTDIIQKYADSKFSWGKVDCCIFSGNVVEEFKDVYYPNWHEALTYSNRKSAVKTIKKLGGTSLADLPTAVFNTERKDISDVQHGDIVYYINEDGQGILGVCNGVRAYFLQVGGGLTARMVKDCKYCWSIN
jgi:hypothetical protein